LGLPAGSTVLLTADGPDDKEAVTALKALITELASKGE
jgi:phosphotransferase system HPr-like phosphotransfer protein